jgi:hypothetical protein
VLDLGCSVYGCVESGHSRYIRHSNLETYQLTSVHYGLTTKVSVLTSLWRYALFYVRKGQGMYRISIDPGLEGTGLAIWEGFGTENDWRTIEPPVKVLSNIHSLSNTWEGRLEDIAGQVSLEFGLLYHQKLALVSHTYIEWPHYRTDPVGQTATAKGDIYKLSALIGALMYVAGNKYTSEVVLVPVLDWKGQLPKSVVARRCQDLLNYPAKGDNKLHISSHGWDAVGIGLHAKGYRFSS